MLVGLGVMFEGGARELDTRDDRENGFYISVEKAGLKGTGLVTVRPPAAACI